MEFSKNYTRLLSKCSKLTFWKTRQSFKFFKDDSGIYLAVIVGIHFGQAKIQGTPVPICMRVTQQSFHIMFSKLQTLLKQVGLTNCNPVETDEAAAALGEALSPAGPAGAEGAPFQFPAPFFEV